MMKSWEEKICLRLDPQIPPRAATNVLYERAVSTTLEQLAEIVMSCASQGIVINLVASRVVILR